MRNSVHLLLLLLVGCAPEHLGAPPDADPAADIVPIAGFAYDSVTRSAAVGVKVELDGKVVSTDAEGRFAANVRAGEIIVRITSPAFEASARTVSTATGMITLPLRRLAPVPIGCWLDGTILRATIVDLQGRKSLERWNRSALTIHSEGGARTIGALSWGYEPPDDTYHWDIFIVGAGSAVERVDWTLFDSDLNAYTGSCVPESGGGARDTIQ